MAWAYRSGGEAGADAGGIRTGARAVQARLHGVLPQSVLGKALYYLTGQWPTLTRFVEDGGYPIDNNACENALRPLAVGRKNWLFADSVGGATASANLYSLIETAKANGIELYRHLRCLLQALPTAQYLRIFASQISREFGS